MANLSARDFINKLASDPDFRSQIGVFSNMPLDEFRHKAAAAGFNYTPEEILLATQTQQGDVLSDEALDNVSGGTITGQGIIHVIL